MSPAALVVLLQDKLPATCADDPDGQYLLCQQEQVHADLFRLLVEMGVFRKVYEHNCMQVCSRSSFILQVKFFIFFCQWDIP